MPTRQITFAGSTVAIEYEGSGPARIVEFLYGAIPYEDHQPAHVTFRLLVTNGSKQLRLYRNDELIHEGEVEANVADILLGNTCYNLADRSQNGLLFHGAGLAWRGQGVLLPGGIGAGKSTLTAWLLGRGFDYLTDELVFVPDGSSSMQTFPRPLNLKRPSRTVLSGQIDFMKQAAQILSSTTTDLVPAPLFNPNSKYSEPSLKLVIFPKYQAEQEFLLQPLSKAQAGLELMQCLVNARNLSDHGFLETTRVARVVPAYKLSYDSFDQIGDSIESLLAGLPQ
jgi:hypothetical protein